MNFFLLRLRFRQLYREAGEIGIFRVLFLLILVVPLLTLFLIQKIAIHPYPLIVPVIVLYVTWLTHHARKDFRLILGITEHPWKIYFTEYTLFTLPVTLLLLVNQLWLHAMGFLTLLWLISRSVPVFHKTSASLRFPWHFMKTRGKGVPSRSIYLESTLFTRFLPKGLFEWQSGIRKNGVVLLLFYLAGIAAYWHIGFAAIALFMLTMVISSFFSEMEPLPMLRAGEETPGRFILNKLARNLLAFALFLLPVLGLGLTHPEFTWHSLGYYFASINMIAFAILLKYHNYRPGAISAAHQLVTTLVCTVSMILPVAILVMAVNLFLWAGAVRNVKSFLDG